MQALKASDVRAFLLNLILIIPELHQMVFKMKCLMNDVHSISIISFVWPIQVKITLFLKAQLVETRQFIHEFLNYIYLHSILFQAPPKSLVDKYLDAIAKTYDVPFEVEPDVEKLRNGEDAAGPGLGGLRDFSEQPTAAAEPPDKKK